MNSFGNWIPLFTNPRMNNSQASPTETSSIGSVIYPSNSRINVERLDGRSMFYPSSTVKAPPPIRTPGYSKRSSGITTTHGVSSIGRDNSFMEFLFKDDLRRYNAKQMQMDGRETGISNPLYDCQEFDQLRFTPINGVKPEDDLPSFLRTASRFNLKSPAPLYSDQLLVSSSIPDSSKSSSINVGHLSFSDISDSLSNHSTQCDTPNTVYISEVTTPISRIHSRIPSQTASIRTPQKSSSSLPLNDEAQRIIDFYSQTPHHSSHSIISSHFSQSPTSFSHPTRSLQHEIYDKAIEYKRQGNSLYEKKDYQAAIDQYTQAIGYNPSDPILFSNRAACLLSMGKPNRALKDALRVVQLNPMFSRGYSRCGKCYLLLGEVDEAESMYLQGLEVCKQCIQRESKEKERVSEQERLDECTHQLQKIKGIRKQIDIMNKPLETIRDVQLSIRSILIIKDHCTNWRGLYLQLIHCYLYQYDLQSAEIVLNRVMPNILPSLSSTLSSTDYAFMITAWDAEKLDLFNNDVSAVDVDMVSCWYRLFLMQNIPNKAVKLWEMCLKEPRFRDWRKADQQLKMYGFLSSWIISKKENEEVLNLYTRHDYTSCMKKNIHCIDEILLFYSQYGNSKVSVLVEGNVRFCLCLENIVFDRIQADCHFLSARCLFHLERYRDVIVECDKSIQLSMNRMEYYKKRGQSFCLLSLYDSGLTDFRRYLQMKPDDKQISQAYSYYFTKAEKQKEKETKQRGNSMNRPFTNAYSSSSSSPFSSSSSSDFYRFEKNKRSRVNQESRTNPSEYSSSPFKSKRSKDSKEHSYYSEQQPGNDNLPKNRVASRIGKKENFYTLLEVSTDATEKEIRKSFLRLALIYHPDKNPDQQDQERFLRIKDAYETLIDPDKRRKYNVSF